MTHPFHPLFGQEFECVNERKAWGEHRVYYHDTKGQLRALPVGWTNQPAEDRGMAIPAGRCVFRVEELLELVRLVKRLRERV